MYWLLFIAIILITFFIMEGITWLTHRYVMHGFLWYLHQDHHQKGSGLFEKNDAFFLIFAIPSWLCIMLGLHAKVYPVAAIGFGIAMYGLAYFAVHEVIIHSGLNGLPEAIIPIYVLYAGHTKCITNI